MEREKLKAVLNDIELNHNHSLYNEVYERNINNMNSEAIYYRGNSISYKKLFEKVEMYVKSFKVLGIDQNSEIPVCISNIPELLYLLLATSYVGAKINIFGAEFSDDYKTEIINECNSNYIFVSDDIYENVKTSIENSKTNKVVMLSLTDSLKNGVDPYIELDKHFYDFNNKVSNYKNENIMSQEEFIKIGMNEELSEPVNGGLYDAFTTTYSSGSTNSARPKGIVHSNRSYIVMGRSHDTDLSNAPSMHGLRVLANIPTHSNTNIMSNITDTLIQGSCVAPEPIGDSRFLTNSLLINKPNFVTATRSLIVNSAKQILYDDTYKHVKMPYLFALFSVGEPTSPGEEKFINRALKKVGAGKFWFSKEDKKLDGKLPVSFPLSIAGGDCEHGGIFYTMFKSWFEMKERLLGRLAKNENMGMNTHQVVNCLILDEQGNVLPQGVTGRLYATSPCNMIGYRNNEEATKKFFKTIGDDVYGDCSVLAVKDNYGRITVKGRIDKSLPMYINRVIVEISDIILRDTKNILSCEVVPQLVDDEYIFIAHIEFMPGKNRDIATELMNVEERCNNMIEKEITKKIYYRIHDNNESFMLTGCGKRNNNALILEGVTDKCVKPINEDHIEVKTYFDINKSKTKVKK